MKVFVTVRLTAMLALATGAAPPAISAEEEPGKGGGGGLKGKGW